MAPQFNTHYTVEEARALLPQIRIWLERLSELQQLIQRQESELTPRLTRGEDLGGDLVNRSMRALADLKEAIDQFQKREIQIKDIERGLIDFPAFIGGKEVFLCWEKDEEDIEFWHDLDSGYGGREKIQP
ncbi:MAG: hypothetical protein JWM99_3853 [Verrucomicrobiales bacterium]|nr:hypothetical protein [Verrucomicrobiales bacterium]